MSPTYNCPNYVGESFPRVSGDEPVVFGLSDLLIWFSPRERG